MTVISERFGTSDPGAAERALQSLYETVQLEEPRRFEPFHFHLEVGGEAEVNIALIELGARLRATGELDGIFSVVNLQDGALGMWAGADRSDTSRPALSGPGPVAGQYRDTRMVVANFSEAAVQRLAAAQIGVENVRLVWRHGAPVDAGHERLWLETLAFLRSSVLVEPVIHVDAIRVSALRMLSMIAIDVFGIEVVHPTPPGMGVGEATVRRAQAFIEDNASLPITVEQIADAVHVSVRALQAAFRRLRDTTPTAYLRQVRLQAAHRELLGADPTRASVGEIAHRWGFAHLGRFAGEYFAAFAELPHETLQR